MKFCLDEKQAKEDECSRHIYLPVQIRVVSHEERPP